MALNHLILTAAAGPVLLLALLFTPLEARAGDEFEDAFKYELGRIAAHEAVHAGRGLLAGIVLGGHYGHPRHRHFRRYDRFDRYYDRGFRRFDRRRHRFGGFGYGPRRHYRDGYRDGFRDRHRGHRHRRGRCND